MDKKSTSKLYRKLNILYEFKVILLKITICNINYKLNCKYINMHHYIIFETLVLNFSIIYKILYIIGVY